MIFDTYEPRLLFNSIEPTNVYHLQFYKHFPPKFRTYERGNQKPKFDKGQTTHCPKRKRTTRQRNIKIV